MVDEGGVDVEVVVDPVVEVGAEVVLVVDVELGTVEEVVVEAEVVDVVDEAGITTCPLVVEVVLDFGGRFVVPDPDVSAKTRTAIATAATPNTSTVLTGNRLRRCAAPIGSVGSPGASKPTGTGVGMIEVRSMADGAAARSEASVPVAPASATGCCSVVSKRGDPPGWVGNPADPALGSPAAPPGSPVAAMGSSAAAPVSTSSVFGPAGATAPLAGGVSLGSSRAAEVPGSP
ncbi:MAG: hypothetical protein ACLP6E_04530 [Acidimicrobiales bacterium]